MAFEKEITLPSGATGDYWRILQRNSNFVRVDDVVTLQLYIDGTGRDSGNTPLQKTVQFCFCPGDHPLTEFDLDTVIVDDCGDLYDLELHVRYTHIKNVAAAAQSIIDDTPENSEPILTANEEQAVWFLDAVSV